MIWVAESPARVVPKLCPFPDGAGTCPYGSQIQYIVAMSEYVRRAFTSLDGENS